jgi:Fur family transcriptional regulator, ferric uptake regulator
MSWKKLIFCFLQNHFYAEMFIFSLGKIVSCKKFDLWMGCCYKAFMTVTKQITGPHSTLERLCLEKGLKMTGQRQVIALVLSDATDHPDVEEVHKRAVLLDPNISIATVYRTVRLFEEAGILQKHEFGDGRARYEETPAEHHDHLIDITTREVIEFVDLDIERLQHKIAQRLGYDLIDHRLELYGVRKKT